MELRQLQYLVAVVEEASFTRAAARVHVAQPGVSAQVRRLERELGQELLDRSGRVVRPTAAGAAVLPFARAALAAVDGARLVVDELAGLVRGRVTMGTIVGCGGLGLADVLAGFHRDHPGVEISLVEDSSDRLIEQLLDGRIDLALVGLSGPPPAGVAAHVVTDEAIVAAVGSGDPWWDRVTVTVGELRDRPLVCLPRGTGMRGVLDGACTAAGVSPRIAFESGDPGVVADLAARGLGVAIIPETGARAHPDLRGVGFEPELRGFVALAWRSDGHTSPAGRALAEHARAALPPVSAQPR